MKTAEGEVFRQRTTLYYDAAGRRARPDTPGAVKKVVESKKWYGRVQDPATGKWRMVPLSRDKQSARKKLSDLQTSLARGEAGLEDPYKESRRAPASEHVAAYLDDLRELGRSERYRAQTGRELAKIIEGCGADTLGGLTADRLDAYLSKMTCSARTKNGYRQAAIGLCNYLVRKKKLPHNPLLATTRRKGDLKRKRRALSREDLQSLLDAARRRPLEEARKVRRGPRKGELTARVTPTQAARLTRIGRHRSLLYLTAVLTGLRLGALKRVRVGYLNLGERPFLGLPGSLMKSGRDYRWPLREDLAAELRAWVAEEGKEPADLLFDIPAYSQTSKLLRKDLKKAGIPYRDVRGRYFDFHSFRKCTGTFLRRGNIDLSVSMKMLDHSDIRMTMEVYNDEELLDSRQALDAMPRLTIR